MIPFIARLNHLADAWVAADLGSDLAIDASGRRLRDRGAGDAAFVAGSTVLALADRGDQAAGNAALGRLDPAAGNPPQRWQSGFGTVAGCAV